MLFCVHSGHGVIPSYHAPIWGRAREEGGGALFRRRGGTGRVGWVEFALWESFRGKCSHMSTKPEGGGRSPWGGGALRDKPLRKVRGGGVVTRRRSRGR